MCIDRTLYIHIGHFKTGSSWIQNALRLNKNELFERSLFYPLPTEEEANSSTYASSGNATELFSKKHSIEKFLSACEPDKHLVLSSEFLFPQLINEQNMARLAESAAKLGFKKIEILLFIRNPISLLVSGWMQGVKNSGEVESIDNVVNSPTFRYYKTPQDVATLMELAGRFPIINLIVRNYSACKGNLLDVLGDWLNIDYKFQHLNTETIVNRTLTSGELLFQRTLNAELGACGNLCGMPLAEKLPNIQSSRIIPSLEVQKTYLSRMNQYMDKVNESVEEAHYYCPDMIESTAEIDEVKLSAEQIKVIASAIGRKIKQERNEPVHLRASELIKILIKRVMNRIHYSFTSR